MFDPKQYRDKAAEFSLRSKAATGSNESHEFDRLEKSFTALADNEQWLADNHHKTVHAPDTDSQCADTLAEQERHVLCCLGAALIMQWNTLPTKLRRELFDNAGTMGALLQTAELRGQIARFLHKHKNDGDEVAKITQPDQSEKIK